jgi:hypothetical protein
VFYFLLELSVLPRYKIDIDSIEYGYPNPQPLFRGDKKEKGYLYVTAPNSFVAENKANELYLKNIKRRKKRPK